MRAKEFIPASKPRNFVAKNQKTGGAGAHRDKKKEQKQGYEKHKGKGVAEGSEREMDIDWHYKNIMQTKGLSDKAKKQTTDTYNKLKKKKEQGVAEGWGQREFEIGGYTYMTEIDEEEDNRKIFHMIKTPDGKTVDVDFTPYAYMTKEDVKLYVKLGMPKRQGVGPLDSKQLQKMAQIKGIAMLDPEMANAGKERKSMEGRRDYGYDSFGNSLRPGDDEGNTEPPNNFAIYINDKKWKVFKGQGHYADDEYEMQQFRRLQQMAARKSQETGKKWEVYRTGEKATA